MGIIFCISFAGVGSVLYSFENKEYSENFYIHVEYIGIYIMYKLYLKCYISDLFLIIRKYHYNFVFSIFIFYLSTV